MYQRKKYRIDKNRVTYNHGIHPYIYFGTQLIKDLNKPEFLKVLINRKDKLIALQPTDRKIEGVSYKVTYKYNRDDRLISASIVANFLKEILDGKIEESADKVSYRLPIKNVNNTIIFSYDIEKDLK